MNQIEKPKKILATKSGMQIYVDKLQEQSILVAIERDAKTINVEGRTVMISDISGIYSPEDIASTSKRESHERNAKGKNEAEAARHSELWHKAVASCEKCKNGWVSATGKPGEPETAAYCPCVHGLVDWDKFYAISRK